jgi:hypothetical protein
MSAWAWILWDNGNENSYHKAEFLKLALVPASPAPEAIPRSALPVRLGQILAAQPGNPKQAEGVTI